MTAKLLDHLWLWEQPGAGTPALNMAWDEVLLRNVSQPILRIYEWLEPSVSFGYFQKWQQLPPAVASRPCVRRWTGGGVVWHGNDLTYSLLVPRATSFARTRPLESYRQIHTNLAHALQTSGWPVELASQTSPGHDCFQAPVEHDLLLQNQKIAGAAQRRSRHGLLHQGSIQLTLRSSEFASTWADSLAAHWESWQPEPALEQEATELARTRYATLEWERRF